MEQPANDPLPDQIEINPIGFIHSELKEASNVPIQPVYAKGCKGRAKIYPDYQQGLTDLEGFSHIFIIYYFHRAAPSSLMVKPYLDNNKRGVFATRSPRRPNPIGISLVHLEKREGNILYLDHVDMLDGTPILDIKPYVPDFDDRENVKIGWLNGLTK